MLRNVLSKVVSKVTNFQDLWQGNSIKPGKHHHIRRLSTGKGSRPPDDIKKCENLIKYIFGHSVPLRLDDNINLKSICTDLKNEKAPIGSLEPKLNMLRTNANENKDETAQKFENIKEPSLFEPEKDDEAKLLKAAGNSLIGNRKRTLTKETKANMKIDTADRSFTDSETKLTRRSLSRYSHINKKTKYGRLQLQNIRGFKKDTSKNESEEKMKSLKEAPRDAICSMISSSKSIDSHNVSKQVSPKQSCDGNVDAESLKESVCSSVNNTGPMLPCFYDNDKNVKTPSLVEPRKADEAKLSAVGRSIDKESKETLAKEKTTTMEVDTAYKLISNVKTPSLVEARKMLIESRKADEAKLSAVGRSIDKESKETLAKETTTTMEVDTAHKLVSNFKPITHSEINLANYRKARSKFASDKNTANLTKNIISSCIEHSGNDSDKNTHKLHQTKNVETAHNKNILAFSQLANKNANVNQTQKVETAHNKNILAFSQLTNEKANVITAPNPQENKNHTSFTSKSEHKEKLFQITKQNMPIVLASAQDESKQFNSEHFCKDDSENICTHESLRASACNRLNQIGPMLPVNYHYHRNRSSPDDIYDSNTSYESTMPSVRIHDCDTHSCLPRPQVPQPTSATNAYNEWPENMNQYYRNISGSKTPPAYSSSPGFGNPPGYNPQQGFVSNLGCGLPPGYGNSPKYSHQPGYIQPPGFGNASGYSLPPGFGNAQGFVNSPLPPGFGSNLGSGIMPGFGNIPPPTCPVSTPQPGLGRALGCPYMNSWQTNYSNQDGMQNMAWPSGIPVTFHASSSPPSSPHSSKRFPLNVRPEYGNFPVKWETDDNAVVKYHNFTEDITTKHQATTHTPGNTFKAEEITTKHQAITQTPGNTFKVEELTTKHQATKQTPGNTHKEK